MTTKINMMRVDISDDAIKPIVGTLLDAAADAEKNGLDLNEQRICISPNAAMVLAGTLYALRMALDEAQSEIAAFAYAGQTVQ